MTATVPATIASVRTAIETLKSSPKTPSYKTALLRLMAQLRRLEQKAAADLAANPFGDNDPPAEYVAPTLIPLSEQLTPEEEDARRSPALAAMTAPAKATKAKAGKTAAPTTTKATKTKATKAATVETPAEKPTKTKGVKTEKEPKERKSSVTLRTLQVLSKAGERVTRSYLKEKTGIKSGWSGILGAVSKDDLGAAGDEGLIGQKLVKVEKMEDGYYFSITAAGKKALADLSK